MEGVCHTLAAHAIPPCMAPLHGPLAWPPCYTLVHLPNWAKQSVLVHCFPTDNNKPPLLTKLTTACNWAAASKEMATV